MLSIHFGHIFSKRAVLNRTTTDDDINNNNVVAAAAARDKNYYANILSGYLFSYVKPAYISILYAYYQRHFKCSVTRCKDCLLATTIATATATATTPTMMSVHKCE